MAEHSMSNLNFSSESESLDAKITLALETAPEPGAPRDFAARMAAQLPPLTPVALTPRGYGRNAAILCMAILLGLIFAFAYRAAGASPVWAAVEAIFCLQFALVAVWLVTRKARPGFVSHF